MHQANTTTPMRRADSVVSTALQSTLTTQAGSTTRPSPTFGKEPKSQPETASAEVVNQAFDILITICTGWKNAVIGDPRAWAMAYKRELLESLVRAGVRDEAAIRTGIARIKARKCDFLPNPEVFADLCSNADDLGIPDREDAYRMAVDWPQLSHADRHPAVLAALQMLDSWQWRRLDDATARRRWQDVWAKIVERVRAEGLGWLPAVPAQLEYQPPGKVASREDARKALTGILADL